MKTWQKALLSLTIVGLLAFLAIRYGGIDFEQVWASLDRFPKKNVLLALLCSTSQIIFMALRFWILSGGLSFAACSRAIFLGHLANNFAPARAGEALKIALLSRGKEARPILSITGIFASDKVVDLAAILVVLLVGGAGLWPDKSAPKVSWGWGLALGLLVVAISVLRSFWLRYRERLRPRLAEFKAGMAPLKNPKLAGGAFLFALGSWTLELFALNFLCLALGYSIPTAGLIAVLIALNIALSVAVSVANLGTFEASMVMTLIPLGVVKEDAIAIAIMHHALQLVAILGLSGFRMLWEITLARGKTESY